VSGRRTLPNRDVRERVDFSFPTYRYGQGKEKGESTAGVGTAGLFQKKPEAPKTGAGKRWHSNERGNVMRGGDEGVRWLGAGSELEKTRFSRVRARPDVSELKTTAE